MHCKARKLIFLFFTTRCSVVCLPDLYETNLIALINVHLNIPVQNHVFVITIIKGCTLWNIKHSGFVSVDTYWCSWEYGLEQIEMYPGQTQPLVKSAGEDIKDLQTIICGKLFCVLILNLFTTGVLFTWSYHCPGKVYCVSTYRVKRLMLGQQTDVNWNLLQVFTKLLQS